MTLLDRFRTQSRDTHPDPAVRQAFVLELPMDQSQALASFAQTDDDPRVRKAAVGKLMDPETLAAIARGDTDEGVRSHALSMLRDIALEAFEGIGEAESLAAVQAVTDPRTLVAIAKSAPREAVGRLALLRISDAHALGSIARHAGHETIRREAFESLGDRSEILSVALNGEFKDTALAAVDRFSERADLEDIAARAKNKHAARRARALLREMDAPPPSQTPMMTPDDTADAAQIQDITPAPVAGFEAPPAGLESPAGVESRPGPELEAAEAPAPSPAAAAAPSSEASPEDDARRAARLAELAEAASQALAQDDFAAARRQFLPLRREWNRLSQGAAIDPAVAGRFVEADTAFNTRDTAAREQDQRARREAHGRIQQLVTRVEALAAKADVPLKAAERAIRDIRTTLGQMPQLPSKADYDDALKRLKAAQAAITPKLQELREIADWQRWANIGIQEQLCEKMEALASLVDPAEVSKQVRDLQQQWREAADVPRAQGEALWKRFKAAHDAAWARCETYFAEQEQARGENLAKKVALCERVEALAQSSNWIQTADEIKKLQAEWKTIGPVSRGQEKAIWERFRSACDTFFTRRQADLAQRKTMWSENLAKKEALCVQAEALAESTDWERAANDIKRLQAEWKAIGPVKRSRSEAIWQRFRGACDHFFTRYAQRHDVARAERVAAREAICAEVEQLAATEEAPADLLQTLRGIRGRWQQELAARGVDRERAAALDQRYAAAFAAVTGTWPSAFSGTEFDPDANRKKMELLVTRIEDLASSLTSRRSGDEQLSPTDKLAAMLKEALASNTIGGKADSEDSRWRAAAEDVRQAQSMWSRLGPVADEPRKALAKRFDRACRQITDRAAGTRRQ